MSDLTSNLIGALLGLVASLHASAALPPTHIEALETSVAALQETKQLMDTSSLLQVQAHNGNSPEQPFFVPFYSQFNDISDPSWKKLGCGIAGLAMLIEYYEPSVVSVDTLLREGIDAGAFLNSAGWTHAGLINLSKKYGLSGRSRDMAGMDMDVAFEELQKVVTEGPVMASVYYTFTPGHPIPHLVVINGIANGLVYYNDPAEPKGGGTIAVEDFKPAWKKRYIEIRPSV